LLAHGGRRRPSVGTSTESRVQLGAVTNIDLCRVLVADDEDRFVELLSAVLEHDGRFEVIGRARDGREAIELVFALAPDAVLMDIDMPVMDGVEATLRINRRRPDLPVIAVSGLDYSERGLEARLAGAAAYVCKAQVDTDLVDALVGAVDGTDSSPHPRPVAISPGRGTPRTRSHPAR
jgi:CheY-like chemotaxis protein